MAACPLRSSKRGLSSSTHQASALLKCPVDVTLGGHPLIFDTADPTPDILLEYRLELKQTRVEAEFAPNE